MTQYVYMCAWNCVYLILIVMCELEVTGDCLYVSLKCVCVMSRNEWQTALYRDKMLWILTKGPLACVALYMYQFTYLYFLHYTQTFANKKHQYLHLPSNQGEFGLKVPLSLGAHNIYFNFLSLERTYIIVSLWIRSIDLCLARNRIVTADIRKGHAHH